MSVIVCVTGKIGSGKSTVARFFEEFGFLRLSMDEIGHLALALQHDLVLETFGTADRRELSKIVFSSQEELRKLELILHPKMIEILNSKLDEAVSHDRNVVVEAAIKRRLNLDRCDVVVTVLSSLENVKRRLTCRYPPEIVERILQLQEDVQPEGYILENNGTIEELREKVVELYGIIMSKCRGNDTSESVEVKHDANLP